MNGNYYQDWTRSTAIYPGDKVQRLTYVSLGLVGEAGEIANKVKKILRDDNNVLSTAKRNELIDELGDVAWYLARVADELDVSLGTVFQNNMNKLNSRKDRGAIGGSGDAR